MPTFPRRSNPNRKTIFQKLSLAFFDRPRMAAVFFVLLVAFGVASYTTFLRREGFPTINVPYSFINGPYLVNNAAKVDTDVAEPLSSIITKDSRVKMVQSQAGANFFNVIIQYKDGTDATAASADIQQKVEAAHVLPASAKADFKPLSVGITQRGDDMLIALYAASGSSSAADLTDKATAAAKFLGSQNRVPLAQSITIIDPYVRGNNPLTGQADVSQTGFDRVGFRENDQNKFFSSVTIGIKGVKGFDVLKLDDQVQAALNTLNKNQDFSGYQTRLSYSAAPSINQQISNLQDSLLEGLIAVLVISAILIALRASFITVASMVTVISVTLGVLYLVGYSLNTITLFSLVLCLSLIVDDTIIMVEAIDAQRRKSKRGREVVELATKKISRAMLAATLTACMAFAPLLFVGGILGSFIRAIPITVITSLLVSFLLALTLIPFISRLILLRPKQLGRGLDGQSGGESISHHLEAFIASTVARPLYWIKGHRRREFGLGLTAVIVGLGFVVAGGLLFSKVTFNIFPPSKDSDALTLTLTFPANQSIDQVQKDAAGVDSIVKSTLGENFKDATYIGSGTTQTATIYIDLLSFKQRAVTAPQLVTKLNAALTDYKGAQVTVAQQDAGPPPGAFTVRLETDKTKNAYQLAEAIRGFMEGRELKRTDGSTAHMNKVTISNPDSLNRNNDKLYVSVNAQFDATDTSTLVLLAQDAVKKEFSDKKLATYGLKSSNVVYDFGAEDDNQNSFKTLLLAFPLLMVAIYILLITQFRSLFQPAIIFMAIPFSFLGITAGLWLTDNPFSFFTMLGFFALIGLSIKNTILLTDYANQARKQGSGAVDAIAIALKERFRPLIATSITAIVSLIPLYLSNPFWEGLAVTLMFGLLSSTFLVITVFPYYYLGAEYLRMKISRRSFFIWFAAVVVIGGGGSKLAGPSAVPIVIALSLLIGAVQAYIRRPTKQRAR